MSVIPYGKQQITAEDIEAVVRVLKSDLLTQGPEIEKFEKAFAEAVQSPYAMAVANGTAALHLAVLALGVKPGDKVLCTANSFVASSNSVLYAGGDIEFVDIDPTTYCIDLKLFEEKLKKNPKAYKGVVAVDFAGHPVVREDFFKIAKAYGLWIIEDACHAVGAQYKSSGVWHKVGACQHSDIAVFSFHPVKHITTGEGGMITTRNSELADKIKILRTHGITRDPKAFTKNDGPWYHEMQTLGFNYRLPDILCALGTSQLQRLSQNIENRQKIAKKYLTSLADLPLQLPRLEEDSVHAFHLFVIQTEKRTELYNFLKQNQIFTQVHYIPIPTQPFYVQKYGKQVFPVAEKYYAQALSLPMYHSLTEKEQDFVIQKIRQFYGR